MPVSCCTRSRLDGALQGLVGLLGELPAEPGTGLVPVRVARLVCAHRRRPRPPMPRSASPAAANAAPAADLLLRDAAGRPVAVLEACTLQRIRLPGRTDPAEGAFHVALVPAAPLPGQDTATRPGLWPLP